MKYAFNLKFDWIFTTFDWSRKSSQLCSKKGCIHHNPILSPIEVFLNLLFYVYGVLIKERVEDHKGI